MTFFIAPAAAVSIAQQTHADDIRRAEQSRLAKQFRVQQRQSQSTETPSGSSWFRAVLGRRQPLH